MNLVMLRGNVSQDPEVRTTSGGSVVANIRLAMSQKYTDREGEQRERTDWVTVVAWAGLAELVRDRVHQGSELFVRGELRGRSWEQEDGTKRSVTEVNAAELAVIEGRPRGDRQRGASGGDDRRHGSSGRDDGRRQGSNRGRRRPNEGDVDDW